MKKFAIILLMACLPCIANAGLITPLVQGTGGVQTEEESGPELSDDSDDVAVQVADLLADPDFQEQQRLIFEQLAAQIESLEAVLRVADDHFDCTQHAERADCVQRKADEALRQESMNVSLEDLQISLAYIDTTLVRPQVSDRLQSLSQVSEPSLLALAFLGLLGLVRRYRC